MKRGGWTFAQSIRNVARQAEAEAEYHDGRVEFWESERSKVMDQIADEGLDVRSQAVTGGSRAEVIIDPSLSKRLSECESKLDEHARRRDEFEQWASVLNFAADGKPTTMLELDFDDLAYFGFGRER